MNPANGATTSLEVNDTTPSKVAAAEVTAAAALSIAVSAMRMVDAGHNTDPRRNNNHTQNK